jgi:hypothetical protein
MKPPFKYFLGLLLLISIGIVYQYPSDAVKVTFALVACVCAFIIGRETKE